MFLLVLAKCNSQWVLPEWLQSYAGSTTPFPEFLKSGGMIFVSKYRKIKRNKSRKTEVTFSRVVAVDSYFSQLLFDLSFFNVTSASFVHIVAMEQLGLSIVSICSIAYFPASEISFILLWRYELNLLSRWALILAGVLKFDVAIGTSKLI